MPETLDVAQLISIIVGVLVILGILLGPIRTNLRDRRNAEIALFKLVNAQAVQIAALEAKIGNGLTDAINDIKDRMGAMEKSMTRLLERK